MTRRPNDNSFVAFIHKGVIIIVITKVLLEASKGGYIMKTGYYLYLFLALFLLAGVASIGFAQSNNCTVMENQGGLVTVSCPGEGPKVINMGGSADIYKQGDLISITGTGQTNKGRDVAPKVR
jgi:hypothetical protein